MSIGLSARRMEMDGDNARKSSAVNTRWRGKGRRGRERGMVSRSSGNRGIKKGGIKSGTIVVLEFF